MYVLTHPDEIEAAKETICQFIADKSGLNIDSVRQIGDFVMTGTSLASMGQKVVKQGMTYAARKVAQETARANSPAAVKQLDTHLARQSESKGTSSQIKSGSNEKADKKLEHIGSHQPIIAPKKLEAFPDAELVRPKNFNKAGSMRKRWEDKKYIYEWESRHGAVEKFTKSGENLGKFNAQTGE